MVVNEIQCNVLMRMLSVMYNTHTHTHTQAELYIDTPMGIRKFIMAVARLTLVWFPDDLHELLRSSGDQSPNLWHSCSHML